MQGIVRGATGARDRKSEEHKTKGTRAEYGDGDGEQFMNATKSVFQILSTRLYSLGIPETVKLKIAVKSKGNQ